MPQPLRVDTADLRNSAGLLDVATDAATTQLSQNSSAMAGCQSGWVGTTFAAFERLRDTWDGLDAARADRLGDIARNLYRSADLYDHRDEESGADVEQTL